MIRRILLRNWKSHEETELVFGKGTNLLVGIMGAGKSAVLDAMAFALFGTFPALAQRRVRLAEIIMGRPREKREAQVELEFEWEGRSYLVKRSVERNGGSGAELRREGALIITEPEKVTEEIERLLKINYEIFSRAIYAEQNRIDYFLLLGPGERKAQIDELLGIDRFEAARSNITTAANLLKRRKEERESLLRRIDVAALEAGLGIAKGEGARLEREIAERRKALEAVRREREEAGKALRELEGRRREWEELQRRKAGSEHALSRLKREIAEREKAIVGVDAAELGRKVEEEGRLLSAARERLGAASMRAAALERELGAAEAEMRKFEADARRKGELEAALARIEEEFGKAAEISAGLERAGVGLEAVQEEAARQAARIGELGIEVEELSKEGTACPVCERPMDARMRGRLLEKKMGESKAGREAEGKARERIAALRKEIARFEGAMRDAERLVASLGELSGVGERRAKAREAADGRMAELEARNGEGKKAEEEIAGRLGAIESGNTVLSAARELSARRREASEIEAELKEILGRIAGLRFDESVYDGARGAADAARERELRCEGDAREAAANLNAVRERVGNFERELAGVAEQRSEIEKYSGLAEELALLNNAVVETQAALRMELIGAINDVMAELWLVVYPYRDYSGVRLMPAEKDYSLELCAHGMWMPVERVASGGERSCASLVLRIALAMVLVPNLKWLVLDEPTHNLDENGIRALVEALHERIPEIVEQMFVITHDENLKDAASARLYRFERNKELDEPTKVTALQ